MTPDRKKPGVAFWATVVVTCLMLYVLSIGPVCRYSAMQNRDGLWYPDWFDPVYWPVGWCAADERSFANRTLSWYVRLWLPADSCVVIPDGRSEVLENGVRAYSIIEIENQYTGER